MRWMDAQDLADFLPSGDGRGRGAVRARDAQARLAAALERQRAARRGLDRQAPAPALAASAAPNSYAAAARRAMPAVVSVTASKAPQRNPRAEDPWFRFFFGDRARLQPQSGLGSGVIVSARRLHPDQQPRHRRRRRDRGRCHDGRKAARQAGRHRPRHRPGGPQDRPRATCPRSRSATPTALQVGDWCWPSATRSASARR